MSQALRKNQIDEIKSLNLIEAQVTSLPRTALTSRYMDFWYLGGISIIFWAVLSIAQYFRHISVVDGHLKGLFEVSVFLSLFINSPHFMASYKLAYSKGLEFIFRNWFQLLVVPLALCATYGTLLFSNDPLLRNQLANFAVLFMFTTVGWHYAKQTYGCMMVYASFDKYDVSARQKNILKFNLYGIWFLNLVHAHSGPWTQDYYGFAYHSFNLPALVPLLVKVLVATSFASFIWGIYRHKESTGKLPSANFWVSYVAFSLWWLPLFFQRDFYLYLVPMFHSLQYLPFVYRVEKSKLDASSEKINKSVRTTLIALGLVVSGYFAFHFIPYSLDQLKLGAEGTNPFFFLALVGIFINTHHYFIDNVLWRFKDSDVKQHLLNH